MKKIKNILTIAVLYLTIVGLITFSMFILEESLQTVMFSTWISQDINDWDSILRAAELNEKINRTLKIINWSFGWGQPLAFISYRAYAKATDEYISALKSKVMAHSPESFIGKKVEFEFTPRKIEQTEDGRFILSNGRIAVITKNNSFKKRKVVGVAHSFSKGIIINTN